MKLFFVILTHLLSTLLFAAEVEVNDDIVCEMKPIKIDGYEEACNPSIVRWEDGFLLSFQHKREVGVVLLDQNFHPIGTPQMLSFNLEDRDGEYFIQNPKLIHVGNHLYMTINLKFQICFGASSTKIFIAKLSCNKGKFAVTDLDGMMEGDFQFGLNEKNWSPFAYENKLFLSARFIPHLVAFPNFGNKSCTAYAKTFHKLPWEKGKITGGTPALNIGNQFLSFFYSTRLLSERIDTKKVVSEYTTVGAYSFHAKNPFPLTQSTLSPLLRCKMFRRYTFDIPSACIVPGGFVFDDHFVWLVFGKQNSEAWICKMDKQKLLESLVSRHE